MFDSEHSRRTWEHFGPPAPYEMQQRNEFDKWRVTSLEGSPLINPQIKGGLHLVRQTQNQQR